MRWYGTRRFLASRLKKSRLRRDSESVTLTFSSRGTRSAGAGRKSSITRTRPISPAVYLTVLLLIESLSFPPIAGAEDADSATAPGETHRHHAGPNHAEAEVAWLCAAMIQILGDDTARIEERCLRLRKRDAVFQAIGTILGVVPFKARLAGHKYG